jgi:Holliday junction resolvasome RuvABC endonuclease subunit
MYLGIDQSITNTGWGLGLVEDNQLKLLKTGVITPNKKLSTEERVYITAQAVEEIILKYSINKVYIEDVYTPANKFACWGKLLVLKGALEYSLMNNQVLYTSTRADVWRKSIGFKNKNEYLEWITEQVDEKNEHILEAIGILLAGIRYDGYITSISIENAVRRNRSNQLQPT